MRLGMFHTQNGPVPLRGETLRSHPELVEQNSRCLPAKLWQLNCCIPGDKNNDSHQTTTSSPALQTKIWASSWAGKKGQPSQSKSPSSQVEISLVSLPENMTAHTYTSIFKHINIIRYHGIKSLSASLVCAACGNEGLEAGHVDAVAYAARDLHRS